MTQLLPIGNAGAAPTDIKALQSEIDKQHAEVRRLQEARDAALTVVKAAEEASRKVLDADRAVTALLARQFKGETGLTSSLEAAREALKEAETECERLSLDARGAKAAADAIETEREAASIELARLVQMAGPAQYQAIKAEVDRLTQEYEQAIKVAAARYLPAWALARELEQFARGQDLPPVLFRGFENAPGAIKYPGISPTAFFLDADIKETAIEAAKREAHETARRLAEA